MSRTQIYIFIFAIAAARAQLLELLLPMRNTATGRRLTRMSTSIMEKKYKGDAYAESIFERTKPAFAIAKSIGADPILPALASEVNVLDLFRKTISDINTGRGNEDARMKVSSLIKKYGYPLEKHFVVTEDGYKLKMYRIPNNGTAVLLMHGLLGSADDWVVAGPESGLAYLLAKEGYDVWLGNARGNKHSRRHVKMKPSQAKFWDFSWHEIGCYDLPAMIDYVLNITGQDTLKYVGHSQGTTSFFVMASDRPEYNHKVSHMVALSPVAYMANVKSPIIRLLAPGQMLIYAITKALGIYEFLPDNGIMTLIKDILCKTKEVEVPDSVCSNFLFIVGGFSFEQMNMTNLPVIYGHIPSGASTKQLIHYGQGVISGGFRKFDYGYSENYKKYGNKVPPRYNLTNIDIPISMIYSESDWLSSHKDVEKLYKKIHSIVHMQKIPSDQFNHFDFVFAKDLRTIVFERLREMMR